MSHKLSENNTPVEKKKHHPVRTFIVIVISLVLFIVLTLLSWCLYSALDRKESLSVIPPEFAAYIRTDRLWKSVNPLIDVKAIDVFLSDPKYGNVRNAVMQLRASDVRNNRWIAFAGNRRVDAAFYGDNSFSVAIDMGVFSAVTRLASPLHTFIQVKGLSFVTSEKKSWFQYDAGQMVIYAKPYHNLLIASSSKKRFDKMCAALCESEYSEERLKQLSQKLKAPFRVACDVNTLLAYDETIEYKADKFVKPLLKKDTLAFVDFGLTDNDMHLQLSFPLANMTKENVTQYAQDNKISEAIAAIVVDSSSKSALLDELTDSVQYYTLINIAPATQLVTAAIPLIPSDKNFESLWANGETLCKMFFSLSLEDLLYSWTGKEIAVIGLEGKKDPVFAIQVTDEQKRADVFKKITDSLVVDENNSLILNGMHVPQLKLPDFLQKIFGALNVKIAKPYYFVKNGFIYFSESAENIVQLATDAEIKTLKSTDTFKAASTLQKQNTSMSLYYNLARSVPFFLKSKSSLSKMLQLYNIGRADVRIDRSYDGEGNLVVLLQAISRQEKERTSVPGYPLSLDGKTNEMLCRSNQKKTQILFWVQDGKTIQMYNADTSATATYTGDSDVFIIPAGKNSAGMLWGVTKNGSVSLFDKELKCMTGYPVQLTTGTSVAPVLYKDGIVVYEDGGLFATVDESGAKNEFSLGNAISLKSSPAVWNDTIVYYNKKLVGELVAVDSFETAATVDQASLNRYSASIKGIAYGSPAVLEQNSAFIVAFVTQGGLCSLYDSTLVPCSCSPVQLEGLYYGNVVTDGKAFYALNSNALLTRITTEGAVLSTQIQNLTAQQNCMITLYDYDGNGSEELFVNGDSNMIYGFTDSLELLKDFPVAGTGAPVFADLDGDNRNECITLSLDGKLNAYKVLRK